MIKMPKYMNGLFYVAISILLMFATILKLRRIIYNYQVSSYKAKKLFKNQLEDFFLLDLIILLAIFITFYFNQKKETLLTLLAITLLAIFYLMLELRYIRLKLLYRSAKSFNQFIFVAITTSYLLFLSLLLYLLKDTGIFYVSFIYTFFIFYIFVFFIPLFNLYNKSKSKKYKQIILSHTFKNQEVYLIVGVEESNSFKSILELFLYKKINFSLSLDSFVNKKEFYENFVKLINKKQIIMTCPNFSYVEDFVKKENVHQVIFNQDKISEKIFKKEYNSKDVAIVYKNKEYKVSQNKLNSDFVYDYSIINKDFVKTSLHLKNKLINKFQSDVLFSLNQKVLAAIYSLIYLLKIKIYNETINTNLFEYLKISKEEDLYIINSDHFLKLNILKDAINELDDKLLKLGLINLSNIKNLDDKFIKELAQVSSSTFDSVIFCGKKYRNKFLSYTKQNQKLKQIHFLNYSSDSILTASQFYNKKPYIIVDIK